MTKKIDKVSAKKIVNELLVDVFNHILRIEEQHLKERGVTLSMTEVHVLEAISLINKPTMSEVATKLKVTLGTLTTAVSVLVRKNYVSRYRELEDRRKVYLRLTDFAKEVLRIHAEFHEDMIESIFEDLEIDKDEILVRSLENIKKYFKEKY